MSYKSQYFEWDVNSPDFRKGESVGYSIDVSKNEYFNPVLYSYRTFEEDNTDEHGRLHYSLDSGGSWEVFPSGDQGKKFYVPYRLRFNVTAADTGDIFVENNGVIYRIRPDGKAVVENYTPTNLSAIYDFDLNPKDNSIFILGEGTLYRLDTSNEIRPFKKSINLKSASTISIALNGERQNFWQVDTDKVYLKDMFGENIFSSDLPEFGGNVETDKLISVVNKFNGNFLFAWNYDNKPYIFECLHYGKTVSSEQLRYHDRPTDICLFTDDTYLVAYGEYRLGRWVPESFELGARLQHTYVELPIRIHRIKCNDNGTFYSLDRISNVLQKFTLNPFVLLWSYTLSNLASKNYGDITIRQSDNTIIFNNNVDVVVIRDDGDSAIMLNSVNFGSQGLKVKISGEHNPHHAHVRWKALYDDDLNMSSSSSLSSSSSSESSSSNSSSSESSESSSSNSSSSESSMGYSSSSSSSEGYSSSSESSDRDISGLTMLGHDPTTTRNKVQYINNPGTPYVSRGFSLHPDYTPNEGRFVALDISPLGAAILSNTASNSSIYLTKSIYPLVYDSIPLGDIGNVYGIISDYGTHNDPINFWIAANYVSLGKLHLIRVNSETHTINFYPYSDQITGDYSVPRCMCVDSNNNIWFTMLNIADKVCCLKAPLYTSVSTYVVPGANIRDMRIDIHDMLWVSRPHETVWKVTSLQTDHNGNVTVGGQTDYNTSGHRCCQLAIGVSGNVFAYSPWGYNTGHVIKFDALNSYAQTAFPLGSSTQYPSLHDGLIALNENEDVWVYPNPYENEYAPWIHGLLNIDDYTTQLRQELYSSNGIWALEGAKRTYDMFYLGLYSSSSSSSIDSSSSSSSTSYVEPGPEVEIGSSLSSSSYSTSSSSSIDSSSSSSIDSSSSSRDSSSSSRDSSSSSS